MEASYSNLPLLNPSQYVQHPAVETKRKRYTAPRPTSSTLEYYIPALCLPPYGAPVPHLLTHASVPPADGREDLVIPCPKSTPSPGTLDMVHGVLRHPSQTHARPRSYPVGNNDSIGRYQSPVRHPRAPAKS